MPTYEEEMMDEQGGELGDPRRCRVHPEQVIGSADGLHDGVCGRCEWEAEQDAPAAPAPVVATLPAPGSWRVYKDPTKPIVVTYEAWCPKEMVALRPATDAERLAYLAQPGRFQRDFRVGDFLIVEDTGPGVSFAGAGF